MEKQKKTKKKIWLPVLLIALALVLVGGTATGLLLLGVFGQKDAGGPDANALYWNLERDEYVATGVDLTSGRMPRGDALYYITFGCNGEKVELTCADKAVVNQIDMMEVMGLEFDENGVIVGVKTPQECGYKLFSRMLFVTGVEGNVIHTNNSTNGRGVDFDLTINEDTQIYNVNGGALLGYNACEPAIDDELVVLTDSDDNVSHIYVKPLAEIGDLYWNTERLYDSTTQMTTREPDALGYYTYVFAINGEQVTLRTRDMKVATAIDKQNAPVMTLEFDEEGLITKKTGAGLATGGGTVASWYDIIDINGNTVTAERKISGTNFGDVVEFDLRNDCQIYDCTDFADMEGAVTQLRVGDRIHGMTDSRGRACVVYVVGNRPGGTIGWHLGRKWDSTNKVSTRKPAEDGWYYFEMAIGGKPVTVKTDNKAFVDKIDSFVCYGLKLDENNVVTRVTAAQNVYGGGTYASYYWITKIEGKTITAERDGKTQIIDMADNCIAYDVSDHASVKGELTELKVGDRIHGFKLSGKLAEVYVVERPWNASIYWNVERQYDSTKKETKREPDEDGFYWFLLAVDGKQVEMKTRSKEIANSIDSAAAKHKALLHWKGEITKVISTTSITKYSGGTKSVSWVDVEAINGNVLTCVKHEAGHKDDGKTFTVPMSQYVSVYNVDPAGVMKYVGEPTTVQVGDRIHVYHNAAGLATLIFVVDNRVAPLDTTPSECPCAQGVTWEPWDGTTELKNGKYYYLTQDVEAPQEGFIISGARVNLRLDGHTISSKGRCFWIKSDGKLNICDHGTRGKLIGSGVDGESGGVIRLYTATGTQVNLWNIDVMSDGDNTTVAKEGGIASVSGPFTAHNCTFSGGVTSDKGGNIQVSSGGTFRSFDCVIEGGVADNKGGNMNISGNLYMENTKVIGGVATDNLGSNIAFDSQLECVMKDVTITAAPGKTNMYMSRGALSVSGKMSITGGTDYNLKTVAGKLIDAGLDTASTIGVTRDDAGIVMTGTTEDKLGAFTLEFFKDQKLTFADGNIQVEEHIILKEHADHCLCAGQTIEGTSHSCSTVTGWKPLTDDCLEETAGIGSSVIGVKFLQDGNYYLQRDYKLPRMLCIMPGQNITICLNGCELTSSARIAYVAGTLTFTDCVGTGTAIGAASSGGGCIKTLNGGVLNIYGGTFKGTKSNTSGGVIVVSSDSGSVVDNSTKVASTFNMYGGTITGGNASKEGGNVCVWHSTSVVNIYGGVIENGSAPTGGNMITAGTVSLLGGTITGGDVYHSSGTLTIGNKVKLEALTLKSGKSVKISDKGLSAETPIKLVAGAGVFATNVTSDMTGLFKASDEFTMSYDAAAKTMSLAESHNHCVCNGADLGLASHSCSTVQWKPLTEDLFTVFKGINGDVQGRTIPDGHYYLTENWDLGFLICILPGQDVSICLNGYNITRANRIAYIAGELTFTDCKGDAVVTGGSSQNGGCLKLLNGGELNIYGGTYKNPKSVANGGGVIVVSTDSGNTVDATTKKTTGFNFYGGTITGGKTSGSGGNVSLFTSNCYMNMYGGTITGGTATSNGGNISSTGTLRIYGGTITGGSAGFADDVYCNNSKTVLGGEVTIGQIGLRLTKGYTFAIHSSGLTVTTPIEIVADAGTIATGVTSDLSACFKPADSALSIVYDEAQKILKLA